MRDIPGGRRRRLRRRHGLGHGREEGDLACSGGTAEGCAQMSGGRTRAARRCPGDVRGLRADVRGPAGGCAQMYGGPPGLRADVRGPAGGCAQMYGGSPGASRGCTRSRNGSTRSSGTVLESPTRRGAASSEASMEPWTSKSTCSTWRKGSAEGDERLPSYVGPPGARRRGPARSSRRPRNLRQHPGGASLGSIALSQPPGGGVAVGDARPRGVLGARSRGHGVLAPGCRPAAPWLACGYPAEAGRQRRA